MFITEEDRELMDYLEQEFAKYGIFKHGIPLGLGIFDITTNSEDLNAFTWCIQKSLKATKEGKSLGTEEEVEAFLKGLQGVGGNPVESKEDSDWELHRHWTSTVKYRGSYRQVSVWKSKKDGTYRARLKPFSQATARAQMLVTTCMIRAKCSLVDTEKVASERLLKELDDCQQRQYVLTDSFIERGRSGVLYLLRRNRPTLAMRPTVGKGEKEADLLCAMCMHPLAYYDGSWAGVMPPSDEILAHLLHIRSDEHRYWKVCNQHRASDYLSGL
ncbi:MAG: hypothetical protein WAX80_00285 [Minisyncoccia bacterium]